MSPPTASTTSLLEHMPCKQSCERTQRSTWRRLSGRNGTKRVMRFCWMMLEWKKPPGERHFSFLYLTAMELTAVQPAQHYTGKLACLINCTKTSSCFICVCPWIVNVQCCQSCWILQYGEILKKHLLVLLLYTAWERVSCKSSNLISSLSRPAWRFSSAILLITSSPAVLQV